jgi:hypothetical protein
MYVCVYIYISYVYLFDNVRCLISNHITKLREPQWLSRYGDKVTGFIVRGSNSGRDNILLFSKTFNPVQLFPGIKWPEREVNHSPPSGVEVKMSGRVPLIPLYAFMTWTGKALRLLVRYGSY